MGSIVNLGTNMSNYPLQVYAEGTKTLRIEPKKLGKCLLACFQILDVRTLHAYVNCLLKGEKTLRIGVSRAGKSKDPLRLRIQGITMVIAVQ